MKEARTNSLASEWISDRNKSKWKFIENRHQQVSIDRVKVLQNRALLKIAEKAPNPSELSAIAKKEAEKKGVTPQIYV